MNCKSHLFCLIAIIIWSSLEITGKLVGVGIDPFTLTAWRFVIGGLVLLPFATSKKRTASFNISSILHIGSLGILNVCVSMLLLQLAIYYGKASLSAVIISTNPIFVCLFAALLHHEVVDKKHITSLCLGMLGLVTIIFAETEYSSSSYLNLPLGIFFVIAASMTFGLWSILTKSAIDTYGNILTNSISFLAGGAILMIINAILGKPAWFAPSTSNVVFILYLGVVITGIAYLLYFEGMKVISASSASTYFFLKPVIAALLANILLQEKLSWGQVLGIFFIVLSLGKNLYNSINWFKRSEASDSI